VPPATNNNNIPPANQGFAGNGQNGKPGPNAGRGGTTTGAGGRPGSTTGPGRTTTPATSSQQTTTRRTTTTPTTTTRTTTTTPQTTTQVTISTTSPGTTTATTTTAPTTTTTPGGGGGGGGGGDCGGNGISIKADPNNPNGCIVIITGAKPGDEVHEVLKITNVSGAPYTLALKVEGTQNQLWNDLQMGVWEAGTPAPNPLPPLLFWTTQYNDLVTLNPGQSIRYRIQLYLPVASGNADMNKAAVMDFKWKGH
jgi:hypothetical protein